VGAGCVAHLRVVPRTQDIEAAELPNLPCGKHTLRLKLVKPRQYFFFKNALLRRVGNKEVNVKPPYQHLNGHAVINRLRPKLSLNRALPITVHRPQIVLHVKICEL
jgi:hypothetical protein